MSMLHVVNKSPFEKNSLESCLAHAKAGAAILLIEDAVYGALKGTVFESKVLDAKEKCKMYVLEPDIKARGMDREKVIEGIAMVDYGGFVDLTTSHDKVSAWV